MAVGADARPPSSRPPADREPSRPDFQRPGFQRPAFPRASPRQAYAGSAGAELAGGSALASPAIRALFRRRLAELGGLALGILGIALLVSLASYDPRDPSLDTAASGPIANLVGPVGAVTADLLLQCFGLAAVLPGLAMLGWAWRVASHRGLGSLGVRLAATLAALPAMGAALGALPIPGPHGGRLAWPTSAGPGGAAGRVLGEGALAIAQATPCRTKRSDSRRRWRSWRGSSRSWSEGGPTSARPWPGTSAGSGSSASARGCSTAPSGRSRC